MPKIVWDRAGEHYYETGVDHGVLYPTANGKYGKGVAWNGLTSVSESPSGADSSAQYADNIKYLNLIAAEEFGATIEAFTYPDEFAVCDGSAEPVRGVKIGQQNRRPFGFCYRTLLGNDLEGTEYGYLIHLVYGATASPSERAYSTVNDSPEAITFSWEVTTTPVDVPGYKPTANLIIDSTKVSAAAMTKIENALYGTDDEDPKLLMPSEVFEIIGSTSSIVLTVASPASTVSLFGKTVADLQTNVAPSDDNNFTGKLLYNTDYTGFSDKAVEQEGNYLALHIGANDSEAEIEVELIGGSSPVCKDAGDGNYVMRITNATTQKVRVSAVSGRESATKIYDLTGLEIADATSVSVG